MKNIFVLIVTILLIGGCKSTKQLKKVVEPRINENAVTDPDISETEVLQKLENRRIDFKTFSAKIKVDAVTKDGKQPELTAVVRIIKDSTIWISLSATFLNIEVYRLLIQPEQVILLNKQDKIVQYRTLKYLQDVTQLPLDFSTIQDLLVGNPVYFQFPLVAFKKYKNQLLLTSVNEVFKHLLIIDHKNFMPLYSKLDDADNNKSRTATVSYTDYAQIQEVSFPFYRHITVAEKSKIDLKMKFKQVEFNKELSVNFNVPRNYEIK